MEILHKAGSFEYLIKIAILEDLRSKTNKLLDLLARGEANDVNIDEWLKENWTAPFGMEEAKRALEFAKTVKTIKSDDSGKKTKINELEKYLRARRDLRSVFIDLYGDEWVKKNTFAKDVVACVESYVSLIKKSEIEIEKYFEYYFYMSEENDKYKLIKDKIKELLKSEDGQDAFGAVLYLINEKILKKPKNFESKILDIKDLLNEANKQDCIRNATFDLEFIKPFLLDQNDIVRDIAQYRWNQNKETKIIDVDAELSILSNPEFESIYNDDKTRAKVINNVLSYITPEKIPSILKDLTDFVKITDEFKKTFKQFINNKSLDELNELLEANPNLNWLLKVLIKDKFPKNKSTLSLKEKLEEAKSLQKELDKLTGVDIKKLNKIIDDFNTLIKTAAIKEIPYNEFESKYGKDEYDLGGVDDTPDWCGLISNIPVIINVIGNDAEIWIIDPYDQMNKRGKMYLLKDIVVENRSILGWKVSPKVVDKNLLRVLNEPSLNDLLLSLGVKFYEFDPITQKPGEFLPIPESNKKIIQEDDPLFLDEELSELGPDEYDDLKEFITNTNDQKVLAFYANSDILDVLWHVVRNPNVTDKTLKHIWLTSTWSTIKRMVEQVYEDKFGTKLASVSIDIDKFAELVSDEDKFLNYETVQKLAWQIHSSAAGNATASYSTVSKEWKDEYDSTLNSIFESLNGREFSDYSYGLINKPLNARQIEQIKEAIENSDFNMNF